MTGELEPISKVKEMLYALIDNLDEDELRTLLEVAKLIVNDELTEDEELLLNIEADGEKVLWQLATWKEHTKQKS
ncbi:MAG: hypothetical protein DRQ10_07455 [Candidatus Hydrothermota bacterium]|nr:MAG: hypothetical protein DRQ10_07455 [Candidatus Hydrothermae bacterium]